MSDYDEEGFDEEDGGDCITCGPDKVTDIEPVHITISPETVDRHVRERMRELITCKELTEMAKERIAKVIDERVDEWLTESIGKTVVEVVEEYFTTPKVKANQWGEVTGEKTQAVGDYIVDMAKIHMATVTGRGSLDRTGALVEKTLFAPLEARLKELLAEVKADQSAKAEAFVAKMLSAGLKKIGASS